MGARSFKEFFLSSEKSFWARARWRRNARAQRPTDQLGYRDVYVMDKEPSKADIEMCIGYRQNT